MELQKRFRALARWIVQEIMSLVQNKLKCFRPLPRWMGGLRQWLLNDRQVITEFPYPLEVNGGSNTSKQNWKDINYMFPSLREVNGGSYVKTKNSMT